jgi:hypothetical protein
VYSLTPSGAVGIVGLVTYRSNTESNLSNADLA